MDDVSAIWEGTSLPPHNTVSTHRSASWDSSCCNPDAQVNARARGWKQNAVKKWDSSSHN